MDFLTLVFIRDCNTCPSNQCVPLNAGSSSSSHGVSSGAVAGAVIASVIFLAVGVLAYLWYRKRQRLQRQTSPAADVKDTPARAEDVLNRPDPNEKPAAAEAQEMHTVKIYGGASNTTINLDPESQGGSVAATHGHNHVLMATQDNPFADSHSIQSASTGTQSNVIPIALVPPGSVSLRSNPSHQATDGGSGSRRPEDGLNYEHANISGESVRTGGKQYAKSTVSAIRNSIMTTGSFASDLLNETPVIVTPSQGVVNKVLVSSARAEVIRTPPGSIYSNQDGSKSAGSLSVASSRPPVRSPLGGSSFGPLETMTEEQEGDQELTVRSDPFGDEHSPYPPTASPVSTVQRSPAPSTSTFAESEPKTPWGKRSRPVSANTQAGSIIGATISNASRVHLGLDQLSPAHSASHTLVVSPSSDLPHTPISAALSTPRSQYRMTSAKIVSPMSSDTTPVPSLPNGVLERQQRQAIEDMEATRMSRASVVSSTSTRADSILEGFPFVPPSPISDRPIRTPPRSPLAQQAFTSGNVSAVTAPKPSPVDSPLPPPPNRKLLGMSTASQSSTMSNGLGSFPFQIDSGNGPQEAESSTTPSSFPGRQRASLDTLALTADLSSYPLGFDRDAAMAHYPGSDSRR